MSQSQLLKKTIAALEVSNTPYMLTGSFASSLQGEPRLTHDIDLVVIMTPAGIKALLNAFPPPDYYLDERSIIEAIAGKTNFNLLDVVAGDKVDFWLLTDDPFDQSRFTRRYLEIFEGKSLHVSRPEDTILMKLRWAIMSGGSEKQFGDCQSIYDLQKNSLDIPYIQKWATDLGLVELWQRIQRESNA